MAHYNDDCNAYAMDYALLVGRPSSPHPEKRAAKESYGKLTPVKVLDKVKIRHLLLEIRQEQEQERIAREARKAQPKKSYYRYKSLKKRLEESLRR